MTTFFRWLLMAVALSLVVSGSAQAARAFLDRDTVRLGETVTLNIQLDSMGRAEPDLSALAANFRLLGTSSSSQLQLINGQQTASQLWAVALEPLTEGVIGIPALAIGGETTAPLTLTVLPAPTGASAGAGDEVFLEVDAGPLDPYVQQQVSYVIRLHYSVNLAEGQLEEPQVSGARLQRLGGDARFQKTLGNRRYEVVERRYALVPERSGTLEIGAPRFRGAAIDGGRGGFFGGGRRLQATGDAITLDVRPQPPGSPTPWLPAREMQLSDESGALGSELRVGEPITLSLRLVARGLAADQLPELSLPSIANAQVYPDLESSQTGDSGEWLGGERVRRFAIVPTKAGALQIPPLRIAWWNTQTDRLEQAEIPARQLMILPAAGIDPVSTAPDVAPVTSSSAPAGDGNLDTSQLTLWRVLAALFALLWLVTLGWFLRPKSAAPTVVAPVAARAVNLTRWRQALEQGDLTEVARQLRYLAGVGSNVGLDHLAGRVLDPQQAELIKALERRLYAGGVIEDRAEFSQQLRQAFRQPPRWRSDDAGSRRDDSLLPPLYTV